MLNVALPKGREERFAYLYDFSLRADTEVRLAYRLQLFLAGEKPPAFASQNQKSWQCPHLLRKIGKDRQAFLLAGEQEEIRC